ncbi:putative F-box/LRR-repeat protein 23 [Phtheirospermum japonicum]|uniref:Putative F-box/LRR-repeat protein 23 n=1 Tax=Phtheirospermum japonicum TaxID=374723 RepID=A0A830B851_9LAMI|nr:putative F-box/LRR-repeat protein 23 [Phtheirospermum japonicum]
MADTSWAAARVDRSAYRFDGEYPTETGPGRDTGKCTERVYYLADGFGDDDLLLYVSDRSSRLKRLTLAYCDCISRESLIRAVTKFPELEELHLISLPLIISSSRWIVAGDIETISICCPKLKTFAFNNGGYRFRDVDNSRAFAIAKNMPNLRHLGLFGNALSDEGVRAILDGCPHLESLDLRQCYRVELLGDLDKRCSERIKDLRRPLDSTAEDDDIYFSYINSLEYCYGEDGRYYDRIDDDDEYFYDDLGQIEVNYWDAKDRSKKGEIVHRNFPR